VIELVRQVLGLSEQAINPLSLRDRALEAGLEQEDIAGLTTLLFPSDALDNEDTLFQLTEMIHSALRAVLITSTNHERPCFLLDDVDAFDGASLSFVRTLCSAVRGSEAKVMTVSESAMLRSNDERLHIRLGPLEEEGVLQLLRSGSSGRNNATAEMGNLSRVSAGNPFYIEQVLRLLEQGTTELDPRLERLIQMRLAKLPPAALHLFQEVSIFGWSASLSDLLKLPELHGSITEGATGLRRAGASCLCSRARAAEPGPSGARRGCCPEGPGQRGRGHAPLPTGPAGGPLGAADGRG
jgi:hypothetical protein